MRTSRLLSVVFFTVIAIFACCLHVHSEVPDSPGIDAVLILDVSGSMLHSDPEYQCREAALAFVQELSTFGSSRAAVITFSDQLVLCTSLLELDTENGLAGINECLQAVSYTRGDTDIGLAVQKAGEILSQESGAGRSRCMLLLTDGEIDLPKAPDEQTAENDSLTKVLITVEDASLSGITMQTVMLDPSSTLDPTLCRYMADRTGGTCATVSNASDLPGLFRSAADYAKGQAMELEAAMTAQTEAETEQSAETELAAMEETEMETETEEQIPPAVLTTGTIDSPVILKGLFPDSCKASLDLSGLFRLEGAGFSPSASSYNYDAADDYHAENASLSGLRFTAYASDPSKLQCLVDGTELLIEGMSSGSSSVTVYAETTDELSYARSDSVRFEVSVRPVFPSVWIPALIAGAVAAAVLLLVLLLHLLRGRAYLCGTLQWHIKAEHEPVYGVPTPAAVHLEEYGRKVLLSEFVSDGLLEVKDLAKVILTGYRDGVRIRSRSAHILLTDPSNRPSRALLLTDSTQLRILFRTQQGTVTLSAHYISPYDSAETEYADASEERTRMLVPDDYRMAG